jgi:hypothetical protein
LDTTPSPSSVTAGASPWRKHRASGAPASANRGYTLGDMAPNPAPPPSERAPGEEAPQERLEHCGPLTLARHAKDDGRALILFRHAATAADEATPSAGERR